MRGFNPDMNAYGGADRNNWPAGSRFKSQYLTTYPGAGRQGLKAIRGPTRSKPQRNIFAMRYFERKAKSGSAQNMHDFLNKYRLDRHHGHAVDGGHQQGGSPRPGCFRLVRQGETVP